MAVAEYVAFLRAVNLGSRRRVDMARLREVLDAAGMGPADTYLATGNVRLTSPHGSPGAVAGELAAVLPEAFGFEIPTVVLPRPDLARLAGTVQELPPPLPGEVRHYVTLLADPPPQQAVAALEGWDRPGEAARVVDGHVHWWLAGPTQGAALSNAVIERLAGTATTRTARVVQEVARRWA